MAGQNEWLVPCRDAAGRERETHVIRESADNIVLQMPAGESATFSRLDLRQLREALRLAENPIEGGDPCADR